MLSFKFKRNIVILQDTNYRFVFTCQFDLKISVLQEERYYIADLQSGIETTKFSLRIQMYSLT